MRSDASMVTRLKSIGIEAPQPLREIRTGSVPICVYESAAHMGCATAVHIAQEQIRLVSEHGSTSMMVMAAPSAFPFYECYARLVKESPQLRDAVRATDFFQFDEYDLPPDHPATFQRLLSDHLFDRLPADLVGANVHRFPLDDTDRDAACRQYGARVLESGPDLQVKGVGENGHWGFHEPGLPIDGEPKFMRVTLSEENARQQLRDHPDIYKSAADVPKYAYTANVPLFLETKHLIEDNVPQASKAFALLAAYGSAKVDPAVPSSALKRHPRSVVRTTQEASWALEAFRATGRVDSVAIERLVDSLAGDAAGERDRLVRYIRDVLAKMEIVVEG